MHLALGRGRKPERVILDEFSVRRLVVVHLREAHARFGLCPTVMAASFDVLVEEIGSGNTPLFQCQQHFFLIFADGAIDQHCAVLFFDIEAWIVVLVGGAQDLEVAVVLLHALKTVKNTVDRAIATHS